MAERSVLIASPHHWTSPFQVAGQHLARAFLGAGWRVAYVSDPISPLHLGAGLSPDLRSRFTIYRTGGITIDQGRLWAYVPGAAFTPHRGPLLSSRWVHRHWQTYTLPNLLGAVERHGFGKVDLLLLNSAVQSFWLDAVEHRASVLRIGDRMTAFDNYTPAMAEMTREAAQCADLVVYTARSLHDDVLAMRPQATLHLPNGVDLDHFADTADPTPTDLASIPRPRAIYVGALDTWFDFELVGRVAKALPDVSFVLIGPPDLARARLVARPNLHLLGSRPYSELPAYLRSADVGLIPFDVRGHPDLVRSIHPLKLYEYLASGLPIVATRWEELSELGAPAILADDLDRYVAAIRQAISDGLDVAAADSFLQGASWLARARTLTDAVGLGER